MHNEGVKCTVNECEYYVECDKCRLQKIEVTHEKYKAKVGDEFDKTVPAIFTDEPQFTRKRVLNNSFDKMDITKPVLFIAGEEDPVGDNGKGVKAAFLAFDKAGVKDLHCKLYPGLRHEILNEDCGKKVGEYIYSWILERI